MKSPASRPLVIARNWQKYLACAGGKRGHVRRAPRQVIPQWPQPGGIPVEFELPGDEAIMHRDGDRLMIEPVRKRGLIALLKSMKPIEERFPEIDDRVPARENVF
jgi:antitoxin VapB